MFNLRRKPRPTRQFLAENQLIEVQDARQPQRIGLIRLEGGRVELGRRYKLYRDERHGDQLKLFMIGTQTGQACRARLVNGNFRVGNVLVMQSLAEEA